METSSAHPLLSNPLALLLFAAAVAAFVFGIVSMIRAWRISWAHPPFAALGFKRWMMGYAALPYMPEAAMVHVKRHFFSVLTMAACLLALIAVLWIGRV
jgi:hypothetical protein